MSTFHKTGWNIPSHSKRLTKKRQYWRANYPLKIWWWCIRWGIKVTKPCERVYTWGCSTDHMHRGNLEYNTDTYSDSDDTVLHIHLQTNLHGDNWLVQQTSWLNSQLLMMWQGEEETGTLYKYSIPNGLFMLFCSCYYTVDEGQSLLTINRHIWPWTLPNISHYWLFKLFLWTAVMRHDTQVSLNDYWSMTE